MRYNVENLNFSFSKTVLSTFLRQNRRGYTLVELLVAIAVIAILTGMGAAYLSPTRFALQQADTLSLEIVGLLREARTLAMAGTTVETPEGGVIPEGGYGVIFRGDTKTALLFADLTPDGAFDTGTEDVQIRETPAYFPLLRFIAYRIDSGGATPGSLAISDSSGAAEDFWVLFAPNSGAITFGSSVAGAITADTKEAFVDIMLEGVRHYHISLNKVSRYLAIEQVNTTEAAH